MSDVFDDAIARQAYSELLISCQAENCTEDFDACFQEPASDPVEKWANEMAVKARLAGWAVDIKGCVVCPEHFDGELD